MSHAHVCDNCLTVAPVGEAVGWWTFETIGGVLTIGQKDEYHFCSVRCAAEKLAQISEHETFAGRRGDGFGAN